MSQDNPTMLGSRYGDWLIGVKRGATRRHPPSLVFESPAKRYEIPLLWIACQDIGRELLDAFEAGATIQVSEKEFEEAKALLAPGGLTLDDTGCIQVLKET